MHLEASILCISEAFANRSNSVTPVGVPSHILINALQANLQPRAAIRQHLHNDKPFRLPQPDITEVCLWLEPFIALSQVYLAQIVRAGEDTCSRCGPRQ